MKKILVVLTGVVISGAAYAYGTASGSYVGASVGIGGMDTPKLTAATKDQFGNYEEKLRRGVAGRAFAGYLFGIGNNFKYGLEIGGALYPKNIYTINTPEWGQIKYQYTGFNTDLLAVLRCNIYNLNVIGKAGAAYTWQKFEIEKPVLPNDASYNKTVNKSKILPELAIGLGYDFTQYFGAGVTYSYIFGHKPAEIDLNKHEYDPDVYNKVAPVNMLTFDLLYHFDAF